ncbi:MAG: hypothetical protein KBS84_01040 [Treponema sp.]|nr:hypothetical protein [Candidatus Treponema scatequi]
MKMFSKKVMAGLIFILGAACFADVNELDLCRAVYELDVGKENVKVENGNLYAVTSYDGETYWEEQRVCSFGHLITGYNPGTGGGRSEWCYTYFIREDGRHILCIWHLMTSGRIEWFDQQEKYYVWQKDKWVELKNPGSENSIKEVIDFCSQLKKRNINYYFRPTDSPEEIEIAPIFDKYGPWVNCNFKMKEDKFVLNKSDPMYQIAFGTVDGLKSIDDWKNKLDEEDNPVVFAAAFNSDPEMTEYLLQNGFKPLPQDIHIDVDSRHPPVLDAWMAGGNNDKVRDVLLKYGYEFDGNVLVAAFKRDDEKEFLKYAKVIKDYGPILEELGYIDRRNGNKEKHKKYYKLLKDAGCDINKEAEKCRHAFYWYYSEKLDFEMIEYLYKLTGGFPRYVYDNEPPVIFVAKNITYREDRKESDEKYLNLLSHLFKHGCSGNDVDADDNNMLFYFANSSSKAWLEIAKLFIKNGADVNHENKDGVTPIEYLMNQHRDYDGHYEWNKTKYEILDLYLASGARPEDGLRNIHQLNAGDYARVKKLLLESIGDCNRKNKNGNTVLADVMLNNNDTDIVKSMLKKGANPNVIVKDTARKTSKHLVYIFINRYLFVKSIKEAVPEFKEVMTLFMKNGFNVNTKIESGKTAYQHIVDVSFQLYPPSDSLELATFLLENGAEWYFEEMEDGKKVNVSDRIYSVTKTNWQYANADEKAAYVRFIRTLRQKGAGEFLSEKELKKHGVPKDVMAEIYK